MIDLYSDTVTKPTAGMYAAICDAPLGDHQRGDDQTARAFEERIAETLGQPAAIVLPSATMANQIAVMIHCRPGAEVLCDRGAHVYNFEGGGIAANAGAQVRPLDSVRGVFSGRQVAEAVRPNDPHFGATSLVVIENTSNMGGGTVWSDEAFDGVVATAAELGLGVHVDGARLFNAAVAKACDVTRWSEPVDTVQVCFSKGLGCPFGAVLAASVDLIGQARDLRQRLGGSLRQAGVMAAAMNYALDNHVQRLAEDHARLATIARALSEVDTLELDHYETNILYFTHRTLEAVRFADLLRARGVWVSTATGKLRLCTHLGITDADVQQAIRVIREVACPSN